MDYRFYVAEEELVIGFERQQNAQEVSISKTYDENLGVLFGEEPAPFIRQCANKCVFCFIKGLPERFAPQPGLAHGMRTSLYIKDDDYRYSFLFGNFRAGDIVDHIKRLGEMHITCHAQLVLCPTINDGAQLERSIKDLAELRPTVESISVVPVGLTKYNNMMKTGDLPPLRHYTCEEAGVIIEQVEAHQRRFETEHEDGYPFVYLSDEWYYLTGREFPPAKHYGSYAQIENGVGMTRYLIEQWARAKRRLPVSMSEPRRFAKVTLVTGAMARPVIDGLAQDLRGIEGLEVEVLAVVNSFFGAEVTVAGLLCGQDVLAELEQRQDLGDLILLPKVMLDNAGERFLDDITVGEFKERLPVRTEFVRNAQETIEAIRSLAAPIPVFS